MRSGVAVAVRAGAARPRIDSEEALKRAVLAARSIGTSTGPSGVKLSRLFERWGISDSVRERVVTPKPGVPVGALIARGDVELGFQQLSELMHIEGIDVLGPLPASVQIRTTFSAGIGTGAKHPASAGALLDFMASPAAADAKRRHGMAAP
jgi:molybdate transport system substrate-binding protein